MKMIFQFNEKNKCKAKTVLIVENKKKEQCFKLLLSKKNFNLIAVSKKQEIFQAARKSNPDLIILNLTFSKKEGLDMCVKIKASKAIKNSPLLVITNDQDNSAVAEYYANGADRCLKEPVSPKMLLEQIVGLLKSKRKF